MKPFLEQLQPLLSAAIEPGRAVAMRAYMRDQFPFLGIATPARRAAARPLLKTYRSAPPEILLGLCQQLWQRDQREYQYVALDLLAMHYKAFQSQHIPALLELLQQKSWWDTVDGFAAVIGDILDGHHDYMDEAIRHENMWVRRLALLHQLGWRGKTDSVRLFGYALKLGREKEFFIQKAIGWSLRDYARHAPEAVRAFLAENKHRLAPLSVREAAKHL